MKYGTTYGNRNPKPGARRRVGVLEVKEWAATVYFDDGDTIEADSLINEFPVGDYEIVEVEE